MFEINTKVVCVDDKFPPDIHDFYNALPRKGQTYTVRDIVPAHDWQLKGMPAVLLVELVNLPNQHGIEPAFQCHRFAEPEDVTISVETEERLVEA